MPSIIDGNASATFQTPLPLLQGGNGNTTGNVTSSQVAGALNATGSAPLFACRAWVNFNGTGTVAIRASGNVSSITDNGTGLYTINFTTAMPDVNYAAACQADEQSGTNRGVGLTSTYSTSAVQISNEDKSGVFGGGRTDSSTVTVAVFR